MQLPDPKTVDHVKVKVMVSDQTVATEEADYDIPRERWDQLIHHLTPSSKYSGTISDDAFPIVCVVTIVHEHGKKMVIYVRAAGKNPALVSSAGDYYWGTAQIGHDGAMDIVTMVKRVGKKEK